MANPENLANSFLPQVNHNPDVLSCLANLSNDEVFTPPNVAKAMLDMLPQELFCNPNIKFLDPVCKSGVFLREITKRLMHGLKTEFPDMQRRLDHILHNQVYGIAITELTSLLSRRTLYCAKYPNCPFSISHFETITGNIRFKNIKHTWKNGKCVFCGASQAQYEREEGLETHAYEFIHTDNPQEIFSDMKFDVIIGNPPYQLNVGVKKENFAIAIYQKFVQQTKRLNPRYLIMIIPSRWFSGGRGLDDFRKEMLNDNHILSITDYINSNECFSGVDIAGGICYFLRDIYHNGKCQFTSIYNSKKNTAIRQLNEFNIFIRNNDALSIINKIISKKENYYIERVSVQNPFGFITTYKGKENKFKDCIALKTSKKYSYVSRDDVIKNYHLIDKYKVIFGAATCEHGGIPDSTGKFNVFSSLEILQKGFVCTQSYFVADSFDTIQQAQNLLTYFKSKFVRFLVLLTLTSQHISRDKFAFVPIQDFSKPWTDVELYAKYNLTQDEIKFIESMIKPMDLSADTDSEPQNA